MMPVHSHKDYPNVPSAVSFRNLSNDHAYKIHSRSLVTIRQRGGMSVPELYWNLTQSQAHDITDKEKAAAEIVEKEASKEIASVGRRNIPYTGKLGNSRKTGTRESWSKKMAASRIGPAGNDMSKAVTRKTLKYRKRAPSTAIVGTDYYQYNFGHIHEPRVGEGPARHVMWGRDSGRMHMKRPWLAPAAKSTIPLQRQAMITIIKARMKGFFK